MEQDSTAHILGMRQAGDTGVGPGFFYRSSYQWYPLEWPSVYK
jgi:hypothetical protein